MDEEDWYFKLINGYKNNADEIHRSLLNSSISAKTAPLNTHDFFFFMLIQKLNSTGDQLKSKGFNALLGRIFLSLQQIDTLNKFILG